MLISADENKIVLIIREMQITLPEHYFLFSYFQNFEVYFTYA